MAGDRQVNLKQAGNSLYLLWVSRKEIQKFALDNLERRIKHSYVEYSIKLDFNACFEHTRFGGSADTSADPGKKDPSSPVEVTRRHDPGLLEP